MFMEIFKLGDKGPNDPIASIPGNYSFSGQQGEPHLVFMDVESFRENLDLFNFPMKAINEVLDSSQFPNIEFYDEILFMTLNNIRITGLEHQLAAEEINLILSQRSMAVIYHGDLQELYYARKRLDHSNVSTALYTFLDGIMDNNKKIINRISDDAEDLEDEILQKVRVEDKDKSKSSRSVFENPDEYMNRIVELRKEVHLLRNFVEPTQDVIEILEDQTKYIGENSSYFHKLSLKADRLTEQLNALTDIIAEVRASWQSQVDLSFNKIVKLFTVVTAVFAPLNLIAGWFGMNFLDMPLLSHNLGYPFVIVLAILVPVTSLWWFRKNHYL